MNKKGFTLVELLAVLIVLGIILLIAIPKIGSVLGNSKQSLYDNTVTEIERVAAEYVNSNPDVLSNTVPFNILLTTLCSEGYISCPINNPLTGDSMSGYVVVDEDSNGLYIYEYVSS
ncbi:MAG TPA: prepilin-type N-terminal cleavage/methylation domain-containing protein [Bacilli bacterium]|nr:prepilin-type N-terminal cleavage/methylation domain-containing protein [Bacilli bacterium]